MCEVEGVELYWMWIGKPVVTQQPRAAFSKYNSQKLRMPSVLKLEEDYNVTFR